MPTDVQRFERLASQTRRWRSGQMSDAAYAGLYFLHWQFAVHATRFASRRDKRDPRPDGEAWLARLEALNSAALNRQLCAYLSAYQFAGVGPDVPAALCAWIDGRWSLALLERIPSPREVLRMQVEGLRPVTVIADPLRMQRPMLHKPNGFAFMLHDLEHAFKFFHDPDLHAAQKRFFRPLLDGLEQGRFDAWRRDPVFSAKLDYLISDMNTHPLHGFQYLRAILVEAVLRSEGKRGDDRLSEPGWRSVTDVLDGLFSDSGM